MAENRGASIRWRAAVVLAAAFVLAPAASSSAMNAEAKVMPPQARPYGSTYGEWGARWWQWALEAPVADNPVLDPTGADCGYDQSGPVWFLAGTFGGTTTRSCAVPAGKGLFFPILNSAFIATEPDETEELAHASSKARIDAVDTSLLVAEIDGVSIPDLAQYRAHSPTFSITIPEGNIFGAPAGTYGPAAADGFWLMVAPLTPGEHTVHFGGVFANGNTVNVTYHLTVG